MPRVLVGLAAAVLVLGHLYGAFHVRAMDRAAAAAPRVKAAVVQANIDQKLKMGRGSSRAATILVPVPAAHRTRRTRPGPSSSSGPRAATRSRSPPG